VTVAFQIKTTAGLVNAALHLKSASGIVPVALHEKTAGGIIRINGSGAPVLQKLSLNACAVLNGNSIDAGSSGPRWQFFAELMNDGRIYYPYGSNVSVGGTITSQFAARTAAVLALAPELLTIGCATNDLTGTALTPDAIAANYRSMLTDYFNGGVRYVIIRAIMPRNDSVFLGLSESRKNDRLLINAALFALSAEYGGRVKILSVEDVWNPDLHTVDGLHPNAAGAIVIGDAAAAIEAEIMNSGNLLDLYLDASNMLLAADNPQLNGTAGGLSGTLVTGVVRTGWTVASNDSTMSAACSATTYLGANAQNIIVGGTNSTANRVVNFSNAATYSGAVGDKYEAWAAVSLATGAQNLRSLSVSCDTAVTPSTSVTLYPTSRGLAGVARTIVTAPLSAADTSNNFQCIATFAAGVVAADITWAKPYLRKLAA